MFANDTKIYKQIKSQEDAAYLKSLARSGSEERVFFPRNAKFNQE